MKLVRALIMAVLTVAAATAFQVATADASMAGADCIGCWGSNQH